MEFREESLEIKINNCNKKCKIYAIIFEREKQIYDKIKVKNPKIVIRPKIGTTNTLATKNNILIWLK